MCWVSVSKGDTKCASQSIGVINVYVFQYVLHQITLCTRVLGKLSWDKQQNGLSCMATVWMDGLGLA